MSRNWKIARSIYNKITSKCPTGTYQSKLQLNPGMFGLRQKYGVAWCTHGNEIPVSNNYTTATTRTTGGHVRFLNFNTEQERYNAWQSFLTKFVRFCVMLDESTKLVPYMSSYIEPWTDKRFKEHFELTDVEWQLIDTVIKD